MFCCCICNLQNVTTTFITECETWNKELMATIEMSAKCLPFSGHSLAQYSLAHWFSYIHFMWGRTKSECLY